MKFQDMPYRRVDFEQAGQELQNIMEAFQQAKTWEEEMAAHKR